MADRCEIAACVLAPHFDAVRDVFAAFSPAAGTALSKLAHTKLVVEDSVHDSHRHYARCREDGLVIQLAPEAADLDLEQLVAIIAHEFGHAADFCYPGDWVTLEPGRPTQRVVWIGGRDDKAARMWRTRLWHERSDDEIEWAADCVARTVTGLEVTYCGPCMLQCFSGVPRPTGLR